MTSLEAYESFLIKLNRNDSNSNINVPKGKFVIVYNEQAKKLLDQKLKKKLSTNEIDELSSLLIPDVDLHKHSSEENYYLYDLPEDFFDISSTQSVASKNGCTRELDVWPVKDKNIRVLLRDSNYKPSFEYEETLCTAANEKLKVYVDNFKLDNVFLSYYRLPKEIDIAGYINSNNQPSTTINPDLPSFLVNQIINRCALEFHGISENRDGFEIAKDRVATEE